MLLGANYIIKVHISKQNAEVQELVYVFLMSLF